MSVIRKVPYISSAQIVDFSIPVEKLSCISHELDLISNSSELIPTQKAVRTYVQRHAKDIIVEGSNPVPVSDSYLSTLLFDNGIIVEEGDQITYVQVVDGVPVDAYPVIYQGEDIEVSFEVLPIYKEGNSLMPTPPNYGKYPAGTDDFETGSGILNATGAATSSFAYIITTNRALIGGEYTVKVTASNAQNTDGLQLRIYDINSHVLADAPIFDETTATTNGTHTHTFVATVPAYILTLWGRGNSSVEIDDIEVTSESFLSPHTMTFRVAGIFNVVTFSYEIVESVGLDDTGVTLTANNFDTPADDAILTLDRDPTSTGTTRVKVKVTGAWTITAPDGSDHDRSVSDFFILEVTR